MAKLVVFRGDAVEAEERLSSGTSVRIGRDPGNNLVLDDQSKGVSRFHAEIRSQGGGRFSVTDLESRNGVWVAGRRIKPKTEVEVSYGVPVMLGPYELVLEDDVPSDVDIKPAASGQTEVVPIPQRKPEKSAWRAAKAQKAPKPPRPAGEAGQYRNVVAWSAVALVLLSAGAIAWVVYRNLNPPVVADGPAPEPPAPPVTTSTDPQDPSKPVENQLLADAKSEIDAGEVEKARDHLMQLLYMNPSHEEAANLLASLPPPPPRPGRPVAPPLAVTEMLEIKSRPNETQAEYDQRVKEIVNGFSRGAALVDQEQFVDGIAALEHVVTLDSEYRGVQGLLQEARTKRQNLVDEAIRSGGGHETRGDLREARRWYETALRYDPGSGTAQGKLTTVRTKMFTQAEEWLDLGNAYKKTRISDENAIKTYQRILDLLSDGDELKKTAADQIAEIKRR